jgi:peptidoglycan DL-endopeptidase CwlO
MLVFMRPSVTGFLARRRGPLAAGVVIVGVVAGSAGAVGAVPRPTVGQVRAQVTRLTAAEDRAVQQYDQVQQQESSAQARLRLVNAELGRNEAQFRQVRREVAQVAATAYETGSLSVAGLLTSSNPRAVLSTAAVLTQLSSDRHAAMMQFIAAARQLSAAQQDASRVQAAITVLSAQRRARAAAIRKILGSKEALLATLTARQQAAVAAAAQAGGGGTTTAVYTGPTSTAAGRAIAFAYTQLGKPYVWGATGPGAYDCSGLVQAAWAAAGVSIPRTTYEQWAALPHIPMSAIQPGDLIFFNSQGHVAVYVGNNQIIDAPQPGGSVQRISLSQPWYAATLDGAARP